MKAEMKRQGNRSDINYYAFIARTESICQTTPSWSLIVQFNSASATGCFVVDGVTKRVGILRGKISRRCRIKFDYRKLPCGELWHIEKIDLYNRFLIKSVCTRQFSISTKRKSYLKKSYILCNLQPLLTYFSTSIHFVCNRTMFTDKLKIPRRKHCKRQKSNPIL